MEKEGEVAAVPNLNAMVEGQADIWLCLYRAVESAAFQCAVELRLPDIIHSHGGGPVALSQIASDIGSPSLDLSTLSRIMRLLAHMKLFDASTDDSTGNCQGGETLYGLTPASKWLLHDAELSMLPFVSFVHFSRMSRPWPSNFLTQRVKEGGSSTAPDLHKYWEFASQNSEFNKKFNDGMECTARISTKAFLTEYKDEFDSVGSVVDVGGGAGCVMADIVKAHPHIKGTNFDLPHVVATAPVYPGVTHVGGNMFESIPHADAIVMQRVMHNWSDEDCIKILRNCRKSIPEKVGKVVILDVVLRPNGDELFDRVGLIFDLVMMNLSEGKERTEIEWKRVLKEGGFPRYKIIKILALVSIIEAYPD